MKNEDYNYCKQIGKKIKLARLKAGYTQDQLAEKLSLSTRYISQLERGISFGSASTIINICKILNISANFLFEDIINPDNNNSDIFDTNFSRNYVKLNDENKEILNIITSDLVKYQAKNQ